MDTHRTFRTEHPRPPISHEAFLFLVSEVERLTGELHAVTVDRDHWYLKANHTPEEVAEFYHRASQGLDENGAWLWPDSVRTTK